MADDALLHKKLALLGECPRKFHFHGSFFPAAEFGVPCFYTRLSLRWYSELHAYMWLPGQLKPSELMQHACLPPHILALSNARCEEPATGAPVDTLLPDWYSNARASCHRLHGRLCWLEKQLTDGVLDEAYFDTELRGVLLSKVLKCYSGHFNIKKQRQLYSYTRDAEKFVGLHMLSRFEAPVSFPVAAWGIMTVDDIRICREYLAVPLPADTAPAPTTADGQLVTTRVCSEEVVWSLEECQRIIADAEHDGVEPVASSYAEFKSGWLAAISTAKAWCLEFEEYNPLKRKDCESAQAEVLEP